MIDNRKEILDSQRLEINMRNGEKDIVEKLNREREYIRAQRELTLVNMELERRRLRSKYR